MNINNRTAKIKLDNNSWEIIDTVRRLGDATLNSICEVSGIPWTSTYRAVKSLIREEILIPSNDISKIVKVGPKADNFRVNNSIGYFLGISVGDRFIKFRVLDFDFREISLPNGELTRDTPGRAPKIIMELRKMMDEFYAGNTDIIDKLLGIGISWPGGVDHIAGIAEVQLNKTSSTIRISDIFTDDQLNKLKNNKNGRTIPIIFEHNAKAALLAEKEIGSDTGRMIPGENIICFYLGTAISVGLYLNGKLYRGHSNLSGYILNPDGKKTIQSTATQIIKKFKKIEDIDEYYAEKLGKELGESISYIINLLNPELIIFTGGLSRCYTKFAPYMDEVINSNSIPYNRKVIKYQRSKVHNSAPAIGVAISAYKKYVSEYLKEADL